MSHPLPGAVLHRRPGRGACARRRARGPRCRADRGRRAGPGPRLPRFPGPSADTRAGPPVRRPRPGRACTRSRGAHRRAGGTLRRGGRLPGRGRRARRSLGSVGRRDDRAARRRGAAARHRGLGRRHGAPGGDRARRDGRPAADLAGAAGGRAARSLESGECWSGPAARSAVVALAEVSAAASAVGRAVEESLSTSSGCSPRRRPRRTSPSRRSSSSLRPRRGRPGRPPPMRRCGTPLSPARRPRRPATSWSGWAYATPSPPPTSRTCWRTCPLMGPFQAPRGPGDPACRRGGALVGRAVGGPAARRDLRVPGRRRGARRGSRLGPGPRQPVRSSTARSATRGRPRRPPRRPRAVARRIAAEEAAGQHVQLQLLDLAGDRVVLALGDLDTARRSLCWSPASGTPRRTTSPAGSATPRMSPRPPASRAGDVGRVGGLAGLPDPGHHRHRQHAVRRRERWAALAHSLAGLAAARTATATGPSRTTVVAHSYGTVVVDEAADEPGPLAADAVVLLGSPGMEDYATSLEAPAVFDAASPSDPVTWFPLGRRPVDRGHATAPPHLPALTRAWGTPTTSSRQFPTLAAVGEVVAGTRPPD